jgi:phage FluMu protein Com
VVFGRCEIHSTLLTRRRPDGRGTCHVCERDGLLEPAGTEPAAEGGGVAAGGVCDECGAEGGQGIEWWMLSDEEAAYAASAFPKGEEKIEHVLLQCPHCKAVNFPGTEQVGRPRRSARNLNPTRCRFPFLP